MDISKHMIAVNGWRSGFTILRAIRRSSLMMSAMFSSVLPVAAVSQQLELFEPTDTVSQNEASQNRPAATRRDRDGNLVTGPEFSLIGTTRISEDYIIVLRDREGEARSVRKKIGVPAPIPGYAGFEILEVRPKEVSVQYPADLSCVPYENQGVSCDSNDQAKLSLTNLTPLESVVRTSALNDAEEKATQENGSGVNPFEALLQRAANPDVEVDDGGFEPVRIAPDDVPPGMRIVSTPFGDRLVEDEQ